MEKNIVSSDLLINATFKKFGFGSWVEKVFDAWEQLAEKKVVPSGCEVKMVGARDGVVVVKVKSSSCPAVHKIFHTKKKIISALNELLGAAYIKDIKTDFE